jgi:chromate transporter
VTPAPAGDTRVTLGELYRGFLYAGARGFGGAMPWARRMLVEERRWLTAQEFTDVFSLCNFLPGPNIVSVSVIVGSRFAGPRGAVVAFAGVPDGAAGGRPAAGGALRAIRPPPRRGGAAERRRRGRRRAVLATGLRMAEGLPRSVPALGFAILAFVAIGVLRINPLWLFVGAGLLGVLGLV